MKTANGPSVLGITNNSRVLFCMPHPDDEAVFASGLISRLIKENIPTKLIIFTKGEASTKRYGILPTDNLAKIRTRETKTAAKILGIKKLRILSLKDGGLKSSGSIVAKILNQETTTFNPTAVVTLEPDGIYGHPDHIALSQFCRAFTQKNKITLIYTTVTPDFTMPSAVHMAEKDIIEPIAPDFIFPLSLREMITKFRAISAHSTQLRFVPANLSSYIFFIKNKMLTSEYFTIAN